MARPLLARASSFLSPDGTLGGILTSAVLQIEATLSSSYASGAQDILNIIKRPADGSAQSAYDFQLGIDNTASATDPTLNGTVGSPNAYFNFDGGDYITMKGAITTFMKNLHKTTGGQNFWVAMIFRDVSSAGARVMMSTTNNSSTGQGICFFRGSSASVPQGWDLRQTNGSAGVSATTKRAIRNADRMHLIVATHDHASNTTRIWMDGVYISRSHTFGTSTTDGQHAVTLGVVATGGTAMDNGFQMKSFAMGNTFMTEFEEARLRAYYERLHRVSYTYKPASIYYTVSSAVFQIDGVTPYSCGDQSITYTNATNMVLNPADGSAQTAYDFTATGTFAGRALYGWTPNGGDYLQLAANTSFIKNLHKTTGGTDFWIALAFRCDGSMAAETTFANTNSALLAGGPGLCMKTDTAEDFTITQIGATAAVAAAAITGVSSAGAADYLFVLSYSHSNNNWRVAMNGRTFSDLAHTFNTSTADPVGLFTLLAESDGGAAVGSAGNFELYGCSMGNAYIDNTALGLIFDYYNTLHERTYA